METVFGGGSQNDLAAATFAAEGVFVCKAAGQQFRQPAVQAVKLLRRGHAQRLIVVVDGPILAAPVLGAAVVGLGQQNLRGGTVGLPPKSSTNIKAAVTPAMACANKGWF